MRYPLGMLQAAPPRARPSHSEFIPPGFGVKTCSLPADRRVKLGFITPAPAVKNDR